ncbi:alpha/beta fold hydrolase [Pusillimonas sp. TS35]|nr:alpha/beta fold hydrolase [Pusillimonas sp. TS35]
MSTQPGVQINAEQLDSAARAFWARRFLSLSPIAQWLALLDWAGHLGASPGKQLALGQLAITQSQQWAHCMGQMAADCYAQVPGAGNASEDRRFKDPAWDRWPFDQLRLTFLAQERWWKEATHGVSGVSRHHEQVVAFGIRQWLDMFSPGNFLLTNPVVLDRTLAEGGANLARGLQHLVQDIQRRVAGDPPVGAEKFVPGRDVAVTPGKVVFRNRLIELIQYAPTTGTVHPEPVLIVPAWIMKYYILDLSPHNSLIKYLVDNGYTVFCISWKNPDAEDRDLGMDDYLALGVYAALEAVNTIVPGRKVHATGYCLGGTLLSIAAAAMARDDDERLASLTLFAAQTDFSEPGELALFIDESQITLLEAQMNEVGYLRSDQMAGAFQMLRSYDLLWSRLVNVYMLGDRRPMNDLMAWNADATRMPAAMHTQYLRRLFLNNDLSNNRYVSQGRLVSLTSIDWPIFCVGTTADHVAPWRSVYKLHHLSPAEITFVLTSGGHNAGIVSEPGRAGRQYQITTRPARGDAHNSSEEWQAETAVQQGSWWPAWLDWLGARSGSSVKPPRMGAAGKGYRVLCDAPGEYVLAK